MVLQLLQQRQGIMVVAEAHGFTGLQRRQRAEDGRVAETLGNAARVEGIGVFCEHGDSVGGHGTSFLERWVELPIIGTPPRKTGGNPMRRKVVEAGAIRSPAACRRVPAGALPTPSRPAARSAFPRRRCRTRKVHS